MLWDKSGSCAMVEAVNGGCSQEQLVEQSD